MEVMSNEVLTMACQCVQLGSECDTELHTRHLCYIISQGFNLSDEQEYRALVENARYRCDHCGRTAKSDANLCVPVPL